MIRMSRVSLVARSGASVVLLALVGVGCAQNGNGSGGLGGGTGTGGTATVGGTAGAGGDSGVMTSCPVAPPANGAACSGDLNCSYGSQTCCGVSYATEVASCSNGKFSVGIVDAGCDLGGPPCGGAGGAAGAGGAGASGAGGTNCPATPTPEGFSCLPGDPYLGCTYGSTTCCGITYPAMRLTCERDSIVHQAVENPCTAVAGYTCPKVGTDGGAGGAGGIGGAITF